MLFAIYLLIGFPFVALAAGQLAPHSNALLVFMGGAGLALHFLTRWGEHWRTVAKLSPWAYVRQDPAAWATSLIGSLVFWFALPELDGFLSGLPVGWSLGKTPLGALACGYLGSSMGAKALGLLAGKAGIR